MRGDLYDFIKSYHIKDTPLFFQVLGNGRYDLYGVSLKQNYTYNPVFFKVTLVPEILSVEFMNHHGRKVVLEKFSLDELAGSDGFGQIPVDDHLDLTMESYTQKSEVFGICDFSTYKATVRNVKLKIRGVTKNIYEKIKALYYGQRAHSPFLSATA